MAKSKYKQIRRSKRKAYAKGYLTGKDHYRNLSDSDHAAVRDSAKRGYRKGVSDAYFEAKQRGRYNSGE